MSYFTALVEVSADCGGDERMINDTEQMRTNECGTQGMCPEVTETGP
jgi:hypothetical protein